MRLLIKYTHVRNILFCRNLAVRFTNSLYIYSCYVFSRKYVDARGTLIIYERYHMIGSELSPIDNENMPFT